MNGTRFIGLVLALSTAACSGPSSDDPPPDRDTGTTDAGPTALPELTDGLYQGTATDDDASHDATMALWTTDTGWQGRVVLDQSRSFAVELDDERTLRAVDGACDGCDLDAEWQLDVRSTGNQLRFTVTTDTNVPSPGFADLLMVPHDGFKPENSPPPEVERWTGHVIAVEPALTDSPILDSDCELLIRRQDDHIEAFYCQSVDSDSPWLTTIADSFSRDDDFSFVTESGSTRLGYIGELTRGDRLQHARGTIHRLAPDAQPTRDAPTIGSFSLEANIP